MPCILIVDDEPLIGEMLETALGRHSFQVILATSGTYALTLYQAQPGSIDLVLLDVNMPWLDGPQTLRKLQEIDPKVRACFITGNTGPYTSEELLELGALRVFVKPFQMAELAGVLRQLLGE